MDYLSKPSGLPSNIDLTYTPDQTQKSKTRIKLCSSKEKLDQIVGTKIQMPQMSS